MHQGTAVPWGIGRMRPYPAPNPRPYATVTVDPVTQMGVFRDALGDVVEMGRHGSNRATETNPVSTNADSRNDNDHDQDSEQD